VWTRDSNNNLEDYVQAKITALAIQTLRFYQSGETSAALKNLKTMMAWRDLERLYLPLNKHREWEGEG
jgi:hypothetical protein